jgi:hypothetical protein
MCVCADTRKLDDEVDGGVGERTEGVMTAKNLLVWASDATERLMSSFKKVRAHVYSVTWVE